MVAETAAIAAQSDWNSVKSFSLTALAELMVDAYRGTVDWEEGDDAEVALVEIGSTIDGKYGTFIDAASGVAVDLLGNPIAAILVAMLEERPTILFVFTAKAAAKRGLASSLIANSAAALVKMKQQQIFLYVSTENPALSLYEQLGFKPVRDSPNG